jgi:hypothetical protein
MVYSNSTRGSYMSSIANQSSGGGSKKAGFPYQVGRDTWASIAINTCNPRNSDFKCCGLAKYNTTRMPMANISRPIGSSVASNTYFHLPGTR